MRCYKSWKSNHISLLKNEFVLLLTLSCQACDVFYKKCILLHMKCSNVMYVFRIISAISRQFQTPSHVASGTCLLLCLLSMLKLLHSRFKYFMKFVFLFVCVFVCLWVCLLAWDTFQAYVLGISRQFQTPLHVASVTYLLLCFLAMLKLLTHNDIRWSYEVVSVLVYLGFNVWPFLGFNVWPFGLVLGGTRQLCILNSWWQTNNSMLPRTKLVLI